MQQTVSAVSYRQLLEDAAAGNEASFETLVKQDGPRLIRIATWVLAGRPNAVVDAEAAVNEAWMKLYTRLREIRPETYLTYSGKAVYWAAKNILRGERRRPETPQPCDEDGVPVDLPDESQLHAMLNFELGLDLEFYLEHLDSNEREILALRAVGDLAWKEIGEILDVTPDTAKHRYQRACARIRRKLDQDD